MLNFGGVSLPKSKLQQPIDDPASDHHDSWLRRNEKQHLNQQKHPLQEPLRKVIT